jgi:hypothetical protein
MKEILTLIQKCAIFLKGGPGSTRWGDGSGNVDVKDKYKNFTDKSGDVTYAVPSKYNGDVEAAFKGNELKVVTNTDELKDTKDEKGRSKYNMTQVNEGVDFVAFQAKGYDLYPKIKPETLPKF